jgi:hypothetical protein
MTYVMYDQKFIRIEKGNSMLHLTLMLDLNRSQQTGAQSIFYFCIERCPNSYSDFRFQSIDLSVKAKKMEYMFWHA